MAVGLEPVDYGSLGLGDIQTVQEVGVDGGAIPLVCLPLKVIRWLDGVHHRKPVFVGELPVAGVLARDGHDGTCSVAHQHVIGDPDRNLVAGYRIEGVTAGEDPVFFSGEIGSL